jgi:histidyl-tRNA synthetase
VNASKEPEVVVPESSSLSLQPPRGMRDFYPEDMAVRERIFSAWAHAAQRFGFSRYDSCVVESLDLLKRKAGEEIVEQIYAFKDKSGRDLALRPEMTPTLARMVAARQGSLTFPLKWWTIAQCFRYERTTRGRKREHFQWNLDIIGEASPIAEADVVAAAISALSELGLDSADFAIRFSSRTLLTELLDTQGIPNAQHAAVFLALDKRGKMPESVIDEQMHAAGLNATEREKAFDLLSIHSLDDAAERVRPDSPAMANIHAFLAAACAYDIEAWLQFDISVVRGLAYYTGIVFEGFDTAGELRAIFGGGRYDNLLGDIGGTPMTGVGLGFGDVVIAEILASHPAAERAAPEFDLAIGYMHAEQQHAAMRLATQLRRDGRTVDVALTPEKPKKFFSRAGKGDFHEAAFLGPDDVENGRVRIKNLSSREEHDIALT